MYNDFGRLGIIDLHQILSTKGINNELPVVSGIKKKADSGFPIIASKSSDYIHFQRLFYIYL